ncbi:MAG: hypothetical protein K9J12_00925 [Melioribacteraceae bacterium]|nr:hypothetical protein [Melioribacteraceae bacterium]MCF8264726.1 hypothetical protein [Melioribacteraceae bacterium]
MKIITIIVLCIMIMGCSSGENSNSKEPDQTVMPAPSPGTAIIDCEIVSLEELQNYLNVKIKVEKYKSGSGTPLLSEHKLVDIRFPIEDSISQRLNKIKTEEKVLKITAKNEKSFGAENSGKNYWKFIGFRK